MTDIIRSWIINLVIIVLLSTIVDVILPNGNVRKYTKFVVGILIILVIVTPMIQLIKGDLSLDKEMFSSEFAMNLDDIKYKSENLEGKHQKAVMDLYKRKLEQDIAYQAKKKLNTDNLGVRVEINENTGSEDYGSIERIIIQRGISQGIPPVAIEVGTDQSQRLQTVREGEKENSIAKELKNTFSSIYQIKPDQVIVK